MPGTIEDENSAQAVTSNSHPATCFQIRIHAASGIIEDENGVQTSNIATGYGGAQPATSSLFSTQLWPTRRRLGAEHADGLPEVCRAAIIGGRDQDSRTSLH